MIFILISFRLLKKQSKGSVRYAPAILCRLQRHKIRLMHFHTPPSAAIKILIN